MSLLVLLVTLPVGDWLSKLPKAEQQVPKPFVEETRLPGKPPAVAKDLVGGWQLDYSDDDAQIGDQNAELLVNLSLRIEADGRYKLKYTAHWGNPPLKDKNSRGVTVEESGTYKLSRDVLILDPAGTSQSEVHRKEVVDTLDLSNEKHVFVVHWETKRIHLAGRCASYQVDPICKNWQVENVWFTLKRKR